MTTMMVAAIFSTTIALAVSDDSAGVAVGSPYLLVEEVTAEVLAKIEVHRAKIEAAEAEAKKTQLFECFFNDIDATLSRVIDFSWIARNVMGSYGKTATPAQREAFAEAFRAGLVETYGRGLLSYSNQEIAILAANDDYKVKRKVSVRQEIRGEDGNYPLEYTMGLNKSGQWRVINVIINGINLGKTFRNQFVSASQKNGGSIDAVIANWGSQAI